MCLYCTIVLLYYCPIVLFSIVLPIYGFFSHVFHDSRKLPPGKISLRKIPTQEIPTWNIPIHFINYLSSLNTSSINRGAVYMYILLRGRKILISPERLRVFSRNFGDINKIFIQNIFSVLSLKPKVSAHDQIAYPQYHS